MAENTNTEREAFEACYLRDFPGKQGRLGLTRRSSGSIGYEHAMVQCRWEGFLAGRASLSLPAAGQEPVAAEFHYDEMAVELRRIAHKPGSVAVSGTLLRAAAALEARAAPQPAVAAGWVSVKDRLPEAYVGVLLVLDGKHVTTGEYMHNLSCFTWEPHDDELDDSTVTHWMPLPPAPSTEGEARE